MKLSLNWLKEYITITETPAELEEILTAIGLEVEGMDETMSGPDLTGVVVGEVLTCGQHPDADRLRVTTVNVGAEEPLHIVCGAPNVAKGQKVLVATIGTVLPTEEGEKEFKIKKGKIRGQVSEGMI
jgi:phenylalanyl-tRNA synthetase beta chain